MGVSIRRLLAAATLVLASGTAALAAPPLWQVSDADSSIWLFGSIHVFDRPMEWRTPQFDQLLRDADKVYFEMVFDREAYATITRLSILAGYIGDGRTLEDLLPADDYTRLASVVAARGGDIATYRFMMPWLVEMTLAAESQAGIRTTAGVELLLDAEIPADRKAGLETAEEQIGFLADLPLDLQIEGLMGTVAAFETGEDSLFNASGDLFRAWESGDMLAIGRMMEQVADGPDAARYRILLTDRNQRWVPQIEQMLADNEQAMVIVGAAHLLGADGLPALLSDRGYSVERISAAPRGGPPRETVPEPVRRR